MFQYISCYSLSDTMRGEISMLNKFQYISCYSLSNKEIEHVSGEVMFQYISCYSLSWNKVFRLEENISFNTSHVTLYQRLVHQNDCNALVSIHLMLLFICIWQKITGYYYQVSIHLMLLFITDFRVIIDILIASFNTSHVTLYQVISDFEVFSLVSFNTSHVTLYPRARSSRVKVNQFQYISCYSLSAI